MTSRFRRSMCVMVGCLATVAGFHYQAARALDTPNVLMGIDGMTLMAPGLFVNPSGTPNDGFNTFRFFQYNAQPGHVGRYKSVYLYDTDVNPDDSQNFLGISHNARYHSD